MILLRYQNTDEHKHDLYDIQNDIVNCFEYKLSVTAATSIEKPLSCIKPPFWVDILRFSYEIYDISEKLDIYYRKRGQFYFYFDYSKKMFHILGGERDGEVHSLSHIASMVGCRQNHAISLLKIILHNRTVETSQTTNEYFVYAFG